MASALAISAQVSRRLGRETEVTEVVINDAEATEGQNEDAVGHDCISGTSSQYALNAPNGQCWGQWGNGVK